MIVILQDDNSTEEVRQVETALTEIRTEQENFRQTVEARMLVIEETALTEIRTKHDVLQQSMEMLMQSNHGIMNSIGQLRNQIDSQMNQMNSKTELLQSKTTKCSQLDEYKKKTKVDIVKLAEHIQQREKGWQY